MKSKPIENYIQNCKKIVYIAMSIYPRNGKKFNYWENVFF